MLCFRPVEEHVQGTDQCWPLTGGSAGQPDRRGLDGPAGQAEHAAPHPGTGIHRSGIDTVVPCRISLQ